MDEIIEIDYRQPKKKRISFLEQSRVCLMCGKYKWPDGALYCSIDCMRKHINGGQHGTYRN